MKREEYLQAIEAILFVSGKPVKIDDFRNALGIDSDSLQELLLDLENNLRDKGINIAAKKNGYILIPNEKYRRFFERFIKKRRQKFTKDALEVIAILYKERKPKETIDKLRGVNSARMLNQLVKKAMAKKRRLVTYATRRHGRPVWLRPMPIPAHPVLAIFNCRVLRSTRIGFRGAHESST